jgi:NTP pyrophosphatase (non-canonical NTP hydrolase)
MDRYRRNIKQIEDAGKCPRTFYLKKTVEECQELQVECADQMDHVRRDTKDLENLYGEIADLLNCVIYLIIILGLDMFKIIKIMREKVDRGYERGVD